MGEKWGGFRREKRKSRRAEGGKRNPGTPRKGKGGREWAEWRIFI